jgi:hypothetical protein
VKKKFPVPRPTEHAALRAADRSARPGPLVEVLLDNLVTAQRAGDREGWCLCAHRAARALLGKVDER